MASEIKFEADWWNDSKDIAFTWGICSTYLKSSMVAILFLNKLYFGDIDSRGVPGGLLSEQAVSHLGDDIGHLGGQEGLHGRAGQTKRGQQAARK